MISAVLLSFLFALAVRAGVVPTAPGPGQVFKQGDDCTISWKLDTTGKWTNFDVDLMSGSNTAMQSITNVFKNRDGTKGDTTYTWKCPEVTPNSAIYFYQFSQPGGDTTWTTRFAISSLSGQVTPPQQSIQPGGAAIPWGIGHLAGAGAGSTPATQSTATSPANSNATALNTPSPATTNSTTDSTNANTTAASGNTSITTGNAPTQSTSSSTVPSGSSSNGKTPTTSTNTGSTDSANANPSSSDANSLSSLKTSIAALSFITLLIVA